MQTFMQQTDSFERIASEIDNKRLHKQTLEGWQCLLALTKLSPQGEFRDPKGWVNHPVAHMWRDTEKNGRGRVISYWITHNTTCTAANVTRPIYTTYHFNRFD